MLKQDELKLELSWFVRYASAGTLLVLVVGYSAPPATLKTVQGFIGSSEVLTTLALFVVGAPIYHLHRAFVVPIHHLLFCMLSWILENVRLSPVPGPDSGNPVRLLGSKRFGVRIFRRFRAYDAIRGSGFFKDRAMRNARHAINGVPIMVAEALAALAIVAPPELAYAVQGVELTWILAMCCFLVSFLPAFPLHREEAILLRTTSAARRVREILTHEGLIRQRWQTAIDCFIEGLRRSYNGRLENVWLYGSRARGTADEGSDVDVLVVLNGIKDCWLEASHLEKIAWPICLEHDVVLAARPVDSSEFATPTTPLLLNAKKEGISLL